MIKIIYRSFFTLIILSLILAIYLSVIGLRTDKFNSKIISQIEQLEPSIKLKLNDVILKLDPFNFRINAKTIGADLIYSNKIIEIESIKSKISIKSFFYDEFSLTDISISTKPLIIKDLISFLKLLNNNSTLFIAEQFIKKGFLIADLKLEFDKSGKIKKNFKLNGSVKDGKINFEKYDLNKIDFFFEINEKEMRFSKIKITNNENNFLIPELVALKQSNGHFISGNFITENTRLNKNEIDNLINNNFKEFDIQEILFSSKNNFKFKINNDFKIKNLNIKSEIDLDNLKFKNFSKLKDFLPQIKKYIIFKNQKIKFEYNKNNFNINGKGEALLQNEVDKIEYKITKKIDEVKFNSKFQISKNPLKIDILNYKKKENSELELIFSGKNTLKEKLLFTEISLKEKNNIISIKNLNLSNDNKINDLENVIINYIDKEDLKNDFKLTKRDKDYLFSGKSFNINKIINESLRSENKSKLKFFNKDFRIIFNVDRIYLDQDNTINDLKGFLSLNKNGISELNLESKFSNNKNIKFTIIDNGNEKITTLYSYKAKPFVDRYKFIKGFEDGDLDFYSIKKNGLANSTLKIDNFKIQEIPVLAKLLTLASLQGIADLLTGEGIRFTDFEMKFSSKNELMTIEELYAIGPAISILLEGYIQKKKLISLRGTLVPATTVNRTISSIPLIGDILVGKKVGEGVFGVSFKVKGPPGNLETTVNPIKTLTPRFITRTLEKIKKN